MSTLTPQDRAKRNLQRSVETLTGASIMLEEGKAISYEKLLEILTAAIGGGGGGVDLNIDGGHADSLYTADLIINGGTA